jgi:hypothetical protein
MFLHVPHKRMYLLTDGMFPLWATTPILDRGIKPSLQLRISLPAQWVAPSRLQTGSNDSARVERGHLRVLLRIAWGLQMHVCQNVDYQEKWV